MVQRTCDDPGSLLCKTRALVNADDRSLARLSVELDIPFYWLQKFARGDIAKPSVNRVQFVFERLTGRSLVL